MILILNCQPHVLQGYMVLLWVYRAAEIKKNLLGKITADSLQLQVRAIAFSHLLQLPNHEQVVLFFLYLAPPPLTFPAAGWPVTQPTVQYAAHVVRTKSVSDPFCRRRSLFVRFFP
jgi:hypothetical protein